MNISERDSAGEYFTPREIIELMGQGLADERCAIGNPDLPSKGQGPGHLQRDKFDYALSNPPFGAKSKPFEPPVSC